MNNFPSIGMPVLDPSEKYQESGTDKFDQLLADGSEVDKGTHPLYYTVAENDLLFTGGGFDVSVVNPEPFALDWDGVNFWVSGFGDEEPFVWQFDASGNYTGFYIDATVTHGTWRILGITAQDGYMWINNLNPLQLGHYYRYTKAGVYTGVFVDLRAQDADPRALKWDGTYFWVCGSVTDRVYQYDSNFVYTGFSFPAVNANTGIAVKGDTIFVIDATTEDIHSYDKAGQYLYLAGNVSNEDTVMRGITVKGGNLFCVGSGNDRVYEYSQVKVTPTMDSGDPSCPWRVVADLTGGA